MLHRDTRLVRFDAAPGDSARPTSTPIHQTATFCQESATAFGAYDYSRTKNPTRAVLEEQLAELDGGARAFAYSSGMAAVNAVLGLLRPGQRAVLARDLYGGTQRLFDRAPERRGVTVERVDATDLAAVRRTLAADTRLLWVETPSNPLLEICDLRRLAQLAHAAGAWLVVDGTTCSPFLQRPLEIGADVVVHSATKHLSGHGDVTAGAVVVRDETLAKELAWNANAEGTALSPFDSWLLLRGMKTLGVRLDREQETARKVADWLDRHPNVTRVRYPGLPGHPGSALHADQADGPGSLLSFETGSPERSRRIVEGARLFSIAVSFGCVASSISMPCYMSHASVPDSERVRRPLPRDLVRVSVGLEDARDLIEDLDRALRAAIFCVHAP
jgi:cystathionine beta-lyase